MGSAEALTVRDPRPDDEAAWRRLWAGYTAFYGVDVPEPVTAGTWTRILDPNSPVFARLADAGGAAAGFAVCVLHEGTWSLEPLCYLEDLYVDPAARGRGIGAALIDDLVAMAGARGWSRVYWHTQADNMAARALYNRYTPADGFVRYRVAP